MIFIARFIVQINTKELRILFNEKVEQSPPLICKQSHKLNLYKNETTDFLDFIRVNQCLSVVLNYFLVRVQSKHQNNFV